MLELTLWLIAAVAGGAVLWLLPGIINSCTQRREEFARVAGQFHQQAKALIEDTRTPEPLVRLLHSVSANIDNARIVRRLLWLKLTGRLHRHSERPTVAMQSIVDAMNELPFDLKDKFVEAWACGLLANAYSAGLLGRLFLDLVLPDQQGRAGDATRLAPEVAQMAVAA